jgi:hypothetical protein
MKMKKMKIALFVFGFLFIYGNANAQLGGIRRAAERGAERAVEKKAEKETEKAVTKALDKAVDDAEQKAATAEEAKKEANNMEETQEVKEKKSSKKDNVADEVFNICSTPYSPSESEFTFFAMKKGAEQVFATKDAKGKTTSQARNTITEITGGKNAFAISYQSELLDTKGKPTDKDNPLILNYRVVIKDDVMYLDMKEMLGAIEGLADVEASGTAMKIPSNLKVGQTLDDAEANMRLGFINCAAEMTEGKCLAIEDITVEAGTFRCYKISQKVNTSAIGVKREGTTVTWYAKGVGAVKTESYDKKGNLQSVTELVSNR